MHQRKNTAKPIEFWFSVGSTYTYLSVMRIQKVCAQSNIDVIWRPFNVRQVMQEMDNLPFTDKKAAKRNYMWRDLERRAAFHRLPIRFPVRYPLEDFETANVIAALGCNSSWGPDYVIATYKYWFQHGLPAGNPENLARVADDLGFSLEALTSTEVQKNGALLLAANTRTAKEQGIFGAPSFVVNGELFWGDDRLEEAASWANNCIR